MVQGTWVLSLVRELHPTCPNKDLAQPDKYIKINMVLNFLIFVAIIFGALGEEANPVQSSTQHHCFGYETYLQRGRRHKQTETRRIYTENAINLL